MHSGPEYRMLYRLLTKNDSSGVSKFTNLSKMKDGVYVFTLHSDYGRYAKAASEQFRIVDGRITQIYEGGLCSDFPAVNRKHRQQNASLNLLRDIRRSRDDESEILDERCYFPLTLVDVTLPERYQEENPLVKRIYHVVDKASFLDWGLTSDYKGPDDAADDDGHRLRERKGAMETAMPVVPLMSSTQYSSELVQYSAAQNAKRKLNVNGSEGYGEATVGSCHKIWLVLTHLRHLVLHDLHETHWGLLWDLGPHSTFLDIGSGYGKVVMHLRLMSRMRRAVGYECVASRDQIAKQALFALEAEVGATALTVDDRRGSTSSDDAASVSTRPASALTSGDEGSSVPRWISSGVFDGIEFACCDATAEGELAYTHIYIFDWVFSRSTLESLAKVLQRSPFYVLLSFRKVTEWWSYGLVKIQPVAKVPGFKTTGGEGMTCYCYVNVEKLPAQ